MAVFKAQQINSLPYTHLVLRQAQQWQSLHRDQCKYLASFNLPLFCRQNPPGPRPGQLYWDYGGFLRGLPAKDDPSVYSFDVFDALLSRKQRGLVAYKSLSISYPGIEKVQNLAT